MEGKRINNASRFFWLLFLYALKVNREYKHLLEADALGEKYERNSYIQKSAHAFQRYTQYQSHLLEE